MTVYIKPSKAKGIVCAPPSKSVAHRDLICAALSENSVVENVASSKDMEATISCLSALGANIRWEGSRVFVGGLAPDNVPEDVKLDCSESGSTLRFMIPLCLLSGKKAVLLGSKRLFERPLGIYEKICNEQGIFFEKKEDSLAVCGKLRSGDYSVPGNISSQFITGLLFALPLLDGDSTLAVTGNFESASYIDLTLKALCDFGIDIQRTKDNVFHIKGNQHYISRTITVEGDYSNAAFLEAFNLFGGDVVIQGLDPQSLQGDRVYKEMFDSIKNGIKHFDLSDCPDLAPIMFAVSAALGGAEFTGTKRLKIKESDRAEAMRQELEKFGIRADVFENSVKIYGDALKNPKQILYGHNDHRIVMALSVLCSITGGSIADSQAVAKSFPDYFEKISQLGIVCNEA